MGVEILIGLYGAICVSMILFHVGYDLTLRGWEPIRRRRIRRLRQEAELQLERICRGEEVEQAYLRRLRRRLNRGGTLPAFEGMLRDLVRTGEEGLVQAYLGQLQPCFLALAVGYQRRDPIQAAYVSYLLSRYVRKGAEPIQPLETALLSYVTRETLYCRVNALQALCAWGAGETLLTALKLQEQGPVFLHEKILTEVLLTYSGDQDQLIRRLWEALDQFAVSTQVGVLNYIRFQSGAYQREMFAWMGRGEADKEVRLAAVRYMGRYPYPPALELLLEFAQDRDPARWEYAAVSVGALAGYSGPRVVSALKQALGSPNWHVRYGAAASLGAQPIRGEELLDVIQGEDAYAREMMTYQLEARDRAEGVER